MSSMGVLESLNDLEIDQAFGSVFDAAIEAHTIDPEVRKKLPDKCFAIVETDDKGNVKRSYPLMVPGDKAKTTELCSKAIQMFHYCKPNRKPELAKAILRTIKGNKISLTISNRNQIFRFVSQNDFPKSVTIKQAELKSK